MKRVSVYDLLEGKKPEQTEDTDGIKVWDNQPGGHVVGRYQEDNVKYVLVEFDNSPGEHYVYRQGTK